MLYAAILWLTGAALAQDGDYVIGSGDTLDVVVHGHDFQTTGLKVSTSGDISFPYVGKINVVGLTAFEAEARIRDELEGDYLVEPHISVKVADFTSKRVELFGAVQTAGLYNLEGDTTLRSLIAKAGGVQLDRSTGFVTITRDGQTQRIKLSELDGEAGDVQLKNGDVIDVGEGSAIFLAGEIQNPGAVQFNRGLTASQALLMAGGHTEYGRLRGAYILRGEERIQVNLKRVLKGKDADVELKPGDRMVIPVSPL